MKVLGIDTSNLVMSLAVVEKDKLIGEYTTNLRKNHSIRLMPAISMLLDELDMEPQELEGVAVAHGPGSYTGVRIGVTTAKTMAWSLGIPIMGISSLEAVASHGACFEGRVSPLFDARRGQVYTSLFEKGERIAEDRIKMIEDWTDELLQQQKPVLFLGDDVSLHREVIEGKLGGLARFGPADWNVPRAAFVAREGSRKIEAGEFSIVHEFTPQYLQLAEAESKWLASQKM